MNRVSMLVVVIASTLFAVAAPAKPPVSYFPAQQVTDSFSKGAVLFADGHSNYMVHTSRRTAPGMAEVHAKEADVIYVLEGSAT